MSDSLTQSKDKLSTTDPRFLDLVKSWFEAQEEVFVLIRYSRAAGKKDLDLCSSFAALAERLHSLPPSTSVSLFRQRQFPVRGIVTENFIAECTNRIPDKTEFLVLEIAPGSPRPHYIAGESHGELRKALAELRNHHVAVGTYPDFWNNSPDVVSAIVPEENGTIVSGVY